MENIKLSFLHRGWTLVETAHNYYHACKGRLRLPVGACRKGDREELVMRFREVVDGWEEDDESQGEA